MSEPKLRPKLETYLIVTIITVLIWFYAESENVKPYSPFPLNVQFVATAGQDLLIAPARPQQVWLTVRCATSQYAALEQLAEGGPIELVVSEIPDNPEQIVVLSKKRLDETRLGELGLTIVDVQPPTINVRVERLEPVVIPIAPDSIVPDDIQLATPPTIDPPTATMVLPASVAGDLGDVALEARIDANRLARLDENVPHELTVPIGVPQRLRERLRGINAPITPSTARVTITIRKQTDQYQHNSVPILLLAPWAELQRFDVTLKDNARVLREAVELSGPSDVIEQIKRGELKVIAELRLTADDLESSITSKPLRFNVPTGVRVESAIPRLSFTISPRSTAPAATP